MIVRVSSTLDYAFPQPTQVILEVQAAKSPDQVVLEETLSMPDGQWRNDTRPDGRRVLRGVVSGAVSIRYEATVDNGLRQLLPTSGQREEWSALAEDVLTYLLPSRFCPSDAFIRFANRTFADAGDGVAQVMAVMDWLAANVDYVPGSSGPASDAEHTFTLRAGVCRDFAHLAIALCRALNIPARIVSAYAVDLRPPDFHAVVEVFIGGGWWLVDPTRLAPVDGLVRISHGRDAADIAFLTTDQPCEMIAQTVTASDATHAS